MDATPEEWRPVVGYEGLYEISSWGHVRSLDRVVQRRGFPMRLRGIDLRQGRAKHGGYPVVVLSCDGVEISHSVHTLMLNAFVGPRPSVDAEARHLNDIPTDNRLTNLAWGTKSQNMRDAVRNGGHSNASKTQCKWGHEFTAENTLPQKNGKGRRCRACKKRRYPPPLRIREKRRKPDAHLPRRGSGRNSDRRNLRSAEHQWIEGTARDHCASFAGWPRRRRGAEADC